MTRGARRALFVAAATLGNVLFIGLVFVVLLVAYNLTLGRMLGIKVATPAVVLAFLLAVLASSLAYGKILGLARRKWRLDEKLGL